MTGEELKNIRNDRGLTQSEAADKLGISLRTYQNWEASDEIPKSKLIIIRNIFVDKSNAFNENISQEKDFPKEDELKRISFLFAKYPNEMMNIPVVDLTIREKISKEIVKITASKDKLLEYLNS